MRKLITGILIILAVALAAYLKIQDVKTQFEQDVFTARQRQNTKSLHGMLAEPIRQRLTLEKYTHVIVSETLDKYGARLEFTKLPTADCADPADEPGVTYVYLKGIYVKGTVIEKFIIKDNVIYSHLFLAPNRTPCRF